MAITGIDTIEGKQIIAAGATSAKYAGAAKSGNTEFSLAGVANTVTTHSAQWSQGGQTIPYTATSNSAFRTNSAIDINGVVSPQGATYTDYITASISPSGDIVKKTEQGINYTAYYTASNDGEAITLSSQFSDNTPERRVITHDHDRVYSGSTLVVDVVEAAKTVKDNSASWGGGSTYTGDAQGALDEVYSNSGEWNESYDTLTANSASWSTTYTGNVQEALDKVYTDSSTWDNVTAKQDKLTFNYDSSDNITGINSSAIGGVGSTYTGNVQQALDEVYTNSGNWNESYETLTANSAVWGGDELPLSAGEGISLSLVDNKLVISDSGLANKEDKLTFAYTDNQISQINGSGIYSQGGGGSQVVTATGGTTAYIQTINDKPVSASIAAAANTATYASNNVSLTAIYNSGRSGYAASSYLVSNVTGKVANWNAARDVVTANSASWAYPTLSTWSDYDVGTAFFGTGINIGDSINIKFKPGNFMTSYSTGTYRICSMKIAPGQYSVTASLEFNNVMASQWAVKYNIFTVTNGHIISGPLMFNCFPQWGNEPWLQLMTDSNYTTALNGINRNIRNSTATDNNTLMISFNTIIFVN